MNIKANKEHMELEKFMWKICIIQIGVYLSTPVLLCDF